jgi:hypothetical protein
LLSIRLKSPTTLWWVFLCRWRCIRSHGKAVCFWNHYAMDMTPFVVMARLRFMLFVVLAVPANPVREEDP